MESREQSHYPTTEITMRQHDKPWFNSELRREIRNCKRLHKIARKYKRINDNVKYKRQRNKVNNITKYVKLTFFENVNGLIDTFKSFDSKSYWKLMRQLIGKSTTTGTIPVLYDTVSGNLVYDNLEKANIVNDYFCSISDIGDGNSDCPDFPLRCVNTLDIIFLTIDEIRDVLKSLKLNKASGADKISNKMLQYTSESVCNPLQILFNRSLRECKEQWRLTAHISLSWHLRNREKEFRST